VIERAALLSTSQQIDLYDLPDEVLAARPDDDPVTASEPVCLRTARRAFEARMIERALRATGGNRTHAARRLGISHRALLYKLKELGVSR
jgi:two-component system response regulator AtoC